MATINLVDATARTSVTNTDYVAIWPTTVTSSSQLNKVAVSYLVSHINNSASTTYVKQTVIDSKGDIIVGTASDTASVLPVGTDGYLLIADSTVTPQGLKWSQVQTTGIADNAVTYSKLKTLQVGTALTGGSPTIDFTGAGLVTHSISGSVTSVTYAGSNYAPGTTVTVRVQNSSTTVSLAFPSWKFVGFKPTIMLPNKTALLSITCFGTGGASDCVAAWAVEV